MMRFVREIPEIRIIDKEVKDYETYGFTLVWKTDSLEVWAEVKDENEIKMAA